MPSDKCEEIVGKITDAFADAPYPGDDNIFNLTAGYDLEENADELKGKHWKDVSLDELIRNRDWLSFLTPQALHFYLPAFLIAAINYPEKVDVLVDNVLYQLVPPVPDKLQEHFLSRAATFNRRQIEAFISLFEAYTEIYPPEQWSYRDSDEERNKRAIAFWKSRIT